MNSSGIPGMALHQRHLLLFAHDVGSRNAGRFLARLCPFEPGSIHTEKNAGDPCSDGARDPAGSRLLRPALFFPVSGKISGIQEKAGTPAEKKRGKKDLHRLSQLYPPASWDLRDPGDPHLVRPGRDHDPEGPLRTREGMPGSWRNSAALYLARSLSHPERSGRSAGGPGPFTSFRYPGHGAGAYRPPDPVLREFPYAAHPGAGKKRPDAGAAAGRISGGPDHTEQLPGLPWLL